MANADERMKILQMVQDGTVSADDGAKLLTALSGKGTRSRRGSGAGQTDPRWMRVRVTDTFTGKAKATVNLPMGLVGAGLNLASQFVPDMDFEELSAAIESGMTGKIVEVFDEEDGEQVEIFIE